MSTKMAAAKEMVRSGRADTHTAAELCGVKHKSLLRALSFDAQISGKRSHCGHCKWYKEDFPSSPEGICLESKPKGAPPRLESYARVRYAELTGMKPFCPFRKQARVSANRR